ncbi:DMT family transporter [Streptomyces gardneri]|uniref:DMT family transporter n=1 Tax=Streptomyces gardneri TaxID=66892 RepID=UPI0022A9E435|nr:multidrug efflux SMR transporter [Streptomyces gardneri]WRK36166.1 multidrug efflux SMR transporter [Streptomyces venezuelae]
MPDTVSVADAHIRTISCVHLYASMGTLVRMGYGLLAGAIVAEILATTSMKYSDGFSKLWPSLITGAGYLIAFALLAQALKTLQVGTAYAIWSGVGTAAVATIGILFLGETLSLAKIAGIVLIVAGVAVLNLGGAH